MSAPELEPSGGKSDLSPETAFLNPEDSLPPKIRRLVLTTGRAIVLSEAGKLARGDDHKRDELFSLGMVVVVEYAPDFNRALASFSTYILPRVRGAMIDFLRREKTERSICREMHREVRREARRFGACHEESYDALADPDEKTVTELVVYAHRVAAATFAAGVEEVMRRGTEADLIERESYARAVKVLRQAVERLSKFRRWIYDRYFCGDEKVTLETIAQELGVNVITVRRHLDEMLDELYALLVEAGIDEMPLVSR